MSFQKWKENLINNFCECYFNYLLKKKIKKDYVNNRYTVFKTKKNITKKFKPILNFEYNSKEKETIKYYCGYGSKTINDFLRYNKFYDINLEKYIKTQITILNNLINSYKVPSNVVVIRHLPTKFCQEYKIGKKYKEKGFLSTSLFLSYRNSYHDSNENILLKNNSLLILKVPHKSNGLFVESIREHEDYELILPHGTELLIEDIVNFWNKTKFIFAKII